jgi:hypothetical protein
MFVDYIFVHHHKITMSAGYSSTRAAKKIPPNAGRAWAEAFRLRRREVGASQGATGAHRLPVSPELNSKDLALDTRGIYIPRNTIWLFNIAMENPL